MVSVRAVSADPADETFQMFRSFGEVPVRPGGVRLSIQTHVLSDFPSNDAKASGILSSAGPSLSSTYSLVYPPYSLTQQWGAEDTPCDLDFFASVYIDENLASWLPEFFAQMAIMQPIDAEIRGYKFPEFLGGGDPAFAIGAKRSDFDGILEVADQVFLPAGKEPSSWSGADEFERFTRSFGHTEGCFANSEADKLVAEIPFGDDTALIRLWADQSHPQLGNGLLVTLQIPFWNDATKPSDVAPLLNFMESRAWTETPQLGCWHTQGNDDERGVLAHTSFVPNALHQAGLVQNFALWEIGRAKWVKAQYFPDMKDRTISEIYRLRFG